MKPLRLYLENFICHEQSFIDFTQFSSALVVAKIANNDEKSNGAGKTSIFKAIEYVLFNQSDVVLERLIRDDSTTYAVILDVELDNQEYRIFRKRTKKGSSDLSLYQRTAEAGEFDDVYGRNKPVIDKKFWKDISGRRAADTEKELLKLIKLNFKAFRNTIHFIQHDFTGLTTVTPEKRKGILKEALSLGIYSKLEKMAKEEAGTLSKQIEKDNILLESLGNPQEDLSNLEKRLSDLDANISLKTEEIDKITLQLQEAATSLNDLNSQYNVLVNKNSVLRNKEKEVLSLKTRIETSIKEYHSKKTNISKAARILLDEIKELKERQLELIALDFSQIEIMSESLQTIKDQSSAYNANIQNISSKLEELRIPMPDKASCKYCRQPLSDSHRQSCQDQIQKEIKECEVLIAEYKRVISSNNLSIANIQRDINSLQISKQKLESINSQISSKNKEVQDKKSIYEEYVSLISKYSQELSDKQAELDQIKIDLENSSIEEENKIKQSIIDKKTEHNNILQLSNTLNKELLTLSNESAVIKHSIESKKSQLLQKVEIKKSLQELNKKFELYPSILQAFSSSGIPNLIIQNVLDDLQIEANNLLSQLFSGLQLSFVIEKTKDDGAQDDTLDIIYYINGKERDYEQLSGAMKLSVMFSLKLGLSFLLQKMIGTDIKFLLLDEIDQSLDKANVDAFADIVKFFQKDFMILIITHNDRLKDKFSHAILVEQDINAVSRAKVVSSW
jgi:DNA repair exonuclease SbcCD ATPase subunit